MLTFNCDRCRIECSFEERVADDTPVVRGEVPFVCEGCWTPEEREETDRIVARVKEMLIEHVLVESAARN